MLYEDLLNIKKLGRYEIRTCKKILKHYYSDVSDIQYELSDMLNLIKSSNMYDIFKSSMDELQMDVLYDSGVHGKDHIQRVCLLTFMICNLEGLDERETELCLWAAKYHDIGRVNDFRDPVHGDRSAQKLYNMNVRLYGEDLDIVAAAIAAHSHIEECLPESMKGKNINENDYNKVLSVLKDADALDRFRLWDGDLNIDVLRNNESLKLVKTAILLVERTKQLYYM